MGLTSRIYRWLAGVWRPDDRPRRKYHAFKELLRLDQESLELLTGLEELAWGRRLVDWTRVEQQAAALGQKVADLVRALQALHPGAYPGLAAHCDGLRQRLAQILRLPPEDADPPYTLPLAAARHHPELVGGKAWALSRVLGEAGLPTPRGFVITTRAFARFLQDNQLRPALNRLLAEISLDDWEDLERLTAEMGDLIRGGEVSPELRQAIANCREEWERQGVTGPWIVRSSAISEDGQLSFAGQYVSQLDVAGADLLTAYKEVLAGKYSARAVSYRLRSGLTDQETPMAALVLEMIPAQVSGVMYTQTLNWEEDGSPPPLALYATCGSCQQVVDGSIIPEIIYLSRGPQPRLLAPREGDTSCLLPWTAEQLAAWGLQLEKLMGEPQDVEWCLDDRGECYILQARPLAGPIRPGEPKTAPVKLDPAGQPLLLTGGMTASPGWGAGRVYLLKDSQDLGAVPQGAVVVSPTLSPGLAGLINRVQAVVSASGSPASHFASVAREAGLPVLCGLPEALSLLQNDIPVIVDAGSRRVYQGEMVLSPETASRPEVPATPFHQRLQQVLALISPLHLLDPHSPDFSPDQCRSFHDLIRFCHEMGMVAMFSLGEERGRGWGQALELQTDLPLSVYILELEECVLPGKGRGRTVRPQEIACPAFQACWQGLSHPDVTWHRGLTYLDWERLDQISAGIFSLKSPGLASYALVAPDYCHFLLRFGYHFAVLDTLCSDHPDANYIAYRFKGGGGLWTNRLRRLRFIETILQWLGFRVQVQGDLLEARLERYPAPALLSRLLLWGILQGRCQLLDLALDDDGAVSDLIESFQTRYGTLLTEPGA